MTTIVFDCDGVLADTERYGHLQAFNEAFAEFGLPLCWSEREYGKKLRIGGGKERVGSLLTRSFVVENGLPASPEGQRDWLRHFHERKTAIYKRIVTEGRLPARPGIRRIVDSALDAGWTLAVASTSAEESVRAVLEHVLLAEQVGRFAVFAGDIVTAKKPDPEIYKLAMARLGSSPFDTLVIEDSANGLLAARGAGLKCLITVSGYTSDDDFSEAALVVTSLGDPDVPIQVIANRSHASPGEYVTLEDLMAILAPVTEPYR